MAQFTVRNLEDDVKTQLKRRAIEHGWSMEEEVRHILRNAVNERSAPQPLGSRIAKRFAGLKFEGELNTLSGQAPRIVDFVE
jgi:antitoxin FitA